MYLYGASGHGKVVAEVAEENGYHIIGFIDENLSKNKILDYQVFHELPLKNIDIIISIGNNKIRKNIADKNTLFNYVTLLHPNSLISKRADVKKGSVVMSGVSINSSVSIGKHCIINTNSSIDHDCFIEDFVHISPNATLGGNVFVGEGTHIGLGASVIQGIKIGRWCTIGAGAVIINDIPDGATVVGNPGRIIKVIEL
ncbi:acetyltransferase EpsM [Chryseobacterium taeanense]|uniref:Acetyltransferase EpsM n=1 Tax=Chryseobacterium taeanense TaxID=311334 RepID=A0A1G8FDB1_9FLAO|nr:acetyltransferase [Chryseobacterium taeanense]SDH80022.1 acetyltransferase EpsM [Chryseobacterium taeanense]